MASSAIADFYEGRSVFITGATGFMGKVLVEKLLRSCPKVSCLYLLMRQTPKKDVQTRLEELLNNPIFNTVKREQPDVMSKVVAITGDITLPQFGVSQSDLQLILDNVSIVFNTAATVRFDEELKEAIDTNVKGPRQMLAMCRKMKRLEALVHVSTAYNNLNRTEIDEVIYPGQYDPIKVCEFVDCIDRDFAKKITPDLVKSDPNTYTYAKALAEQVLERECGSVPLAIVRPSIVTAAVKEPAPGWIDNINGTTGLIAGGAKGFLRVFKCELGKVVDIIPVDYSINLMIAVAWQTAQQKPSQIVVYNSTTGYNNPITIGQLRAYSIDAVIQYPPKEMMMCPSGECTNKDWYFRVNVMLTHYLPAYFLDLFSRLTGKRGNMVRLYKRVFRALNTVNFFQMNSWRFISENPVHLWSKMSPNDRELFYFDVKDINWPAYFDTYIQGIRQWVLKEEPNTVPIARKNLVKLYMMKITFRLSMLIAFVVWLIRRKQNLFGMLTSLLSLKQKLAFS